MNEPDTKLRILNYHAVIRNPMSISDWCFMKEDLFHDQMMFLKKNFEVLPFTEALRRLKTGDLNRPTVVITFDDGFMNNYEVAYPILKNECLPATIYLTTGLIGGRNTLWSCRLIQALEKTKIKEFKWSGRHFNLKETASKINASEQIQRMLKSWPHPELLQQLEEVIEILKQDIDSQVARNSPFRILDEATIRTMLSSGLIELGAHTESHTILSQLISTQKHAQIESSVRYVTKLLGKQCTLFAYPNGRKQDYDQESMEILDSLGVEYAVTTTEGINDCTNQPLELNRFGIGSDMGMKEFELVICK